MQKVPSSSLGRGIILWGISLQPQIDLVKKKRKYEIDTCNLHLRWYFGLFVCRRRKDA